MNLTVIRSPDIDRAAMFYQTMGLLFTKHRHESGPEHYSSCVNGFVFEPALFTTRFFKVLRAAGIAGWGLAS